MTASNRLCSKSSDSSHCETSLACPFGIAKGERQRGEGGRGGRRGRGRERERVGNEEKIHDASCVCKRGLKKGRKAKRRQNEGKSNQKYLFTHSISSSRSFLLSFPPLSYFSHSLILLISLPPELRPSLSRCPHSGIHRCPQPPSLERFQCGNRRSSGTCYLKDPNQGK